MAKTTEDIGRKRVATFEAMTHDLQQVALDFASKLGKKARMQCLVEYDMGTKVREIIEEEAHYGSNAVQQLADYLGKQATAVYAWRNFAGAFDRQFVDATASEPMSNGEYVDTKHFYAMMKVKDGRKQRKLWNQVKQLSWSANQLEDEVRSTTETKNERSGGRKPQTPVSPSAGLESIRKDALKVGNLIPVICEHSCDAIDEMAPGKVDEKLLDTLTASRATVAEMHDAAGLLLGRIDANIDRVERVLESQSVSEGEDLKKGSEESTADEEEVNETPLDDDFDDDFDEDFAPEASYEAEERDRVPVSAQQATGGKKGRKAEKRKTSGK